MARWTQTWTCKACGHQSKRVVRYPKYGQSHTPLAVWAARARCTRCGVRGQCEIDERQAGRV